MKHWMISCIVLVVLALFFFFGMRGYTYISLTLVFIAFLILVAHLGSPAVKRIVAVLTCLGLIYFCLVEYRIVKNSETDADCERGYLIVLGAAVHGNVPSLSLLNRLEGALAYLNTYPDCIAVVSGGQGVGENISEAQCMHDWLLDQGIPENRIRMEENSTSTMENLEFSWEIIRDEGGKADDIAVVSSNYHLYRAKSIAASIGLDVAGVRGNYGYPIYTLGMFIREAFGVTHLWIFGN